MFLQMCIICDTNDIKDNNNLFHTTTRNYVCFKYFTLSKSLLPSVCPVPLHCIPKS